METKLLTQSQASKILLWRVGAVVQQLNEHGIKTRLAYGQSDGFNGDFGLVLSLSNNREILYVAPSGNRYDIEYQDDDDDATIDPRSIPNITLNDYNKKYRQAVISMSEPARTIKRKVVVNIVRGGVPTDNTFIRNFGITLPSTTKYTITNKKVSKTEPSTATVTAKVPASNTSFLVGFDEKHMFVSMLKRKVATVEQAHAELLPKELKKRKDYVRQGEFFFVPATKKEILRFKNADRQRGLGNANGDETDHVATVICYDRLHQFVSGAITNPRHGKLFFDRWMRVILNNEVPNQGSNWD